MRVVVTGAAGFIGSHLCEHLLREGHRVVGIDSLATGSRETVAPLIRDPGFLWRWGEVTRVLPEIADADLCFHLAAHVGPRHVVDNVAVMTREHLLDALAVVDWAKRTGARVVFTSSSEVYGDQPVPQREDMALRVGPTSVPRSAYAATKLACEHVLLWGLADRAVIARLFNVAGPRQRAHNGCVIPKWVDLGHLYGTFEVHDGTATRAFAHVHDVVRTLVELARCPEAAGEIVNVGQATPVRMDDLADMVARELTARVRAVTWVNGTPPPAEGYGLLTHRAPDVAKLRRLIGWELPERTEQIVREVVGEVCR